MASPAPGSTSAEPSRSPLYRAPMGHAPSSHVARPTETRASPERRRLSRSSPRPRSARLEATTPAGDNEPLRVQGLMRCRPTTRILEGGIARVHPQRCPARDRVHVRRDSGRAPAKERRGGKSLRHPVDRPPSPAIAFGAGGTHSRGPAERRVGKDAPRAGARRGGGRPPPPRSRLGGPGLLAGSGRPASSGFPAARLERPARPQRSTGGWPNRKMYASAPAFWRTFFSRRQPRRG
jgi:hypothetical protein